MIAAFFVEPGAVDGRPRVFVRLGAERVEWTGDEARAASVELARVANEVDPPKPLAPRMHHYAAKQEDETRLVVYEEIAGMPATSPRPAGLRPFFSANYRQSIADVRRQALANFSFLELVIVRHDGTSESKLG